MLDLQAWSFWNVLLVSLGWIVLVPVIIAAWILLPAFFGDSATGSGGIGAVSFGMNVLIAPLILFGPPAVLFAAWLLLRR
jgi:hypothetical protein